MRLRLIFSLAALGLIAAAGDAKAFFFCKKGYSNGCYGGGYYAGGGCYGGGYGYGGGYRSGYGGWGYSNDYAPSYYAYTPSTMTVPSVRAMPGTTPATADVTVRTTDAQGNVVIRTTDAQGNVIVPATYSVPATGTYVVPSGYYTEPMYYRSGGYTTGPWGGYYDNRYYGGGYYNRGWGGGGFFGRWR